jgi:hypothetical protein
MDRSSTTDINSVLADFEEAPSQRSLRSKIENLPISADAKSLLMDLAQLTLKVSGKLIAIGRKILALALDLARKFQNVIFGMLIALLLSVVLATIPLLGPSIAALLTPIMLAFGIVKGAIEDFRNMGVQTELDALKQRLAILSSHATA